MLHKMKLQNRPYCMINNGTKTIELRLYDEKRRKIKVNDIIEFTNITTMESIKVIVLDLYRYASFEELYKNFNKIELGYKVDELASYSDMEKYYSKEEQDKYGVLGIRIKKL